MTVDIKTRELCVLKLLNHILQPTMYEDVREVAREWTIEENLDKYLVYTPHIHSFTILAGFNKPIMIDVIHFLTESRCCEAFRPHFQVGYAPSR